MLLLQTENRSKCGSTYTQSVFEAIDSIIELPVQSPTLAYKWSLMAHCGQNEHILKRMTQYICFLYLFHSAHCIIMSTTTVIIPTPFITNMNMFDLLLTL